MKKRTVESFVAITMILCLLISSFNVALSLALAQDQQAECPQIDKEKAKKVADAASAAKKRSFWSGIVASVVAVICAAIPGLQGAAGILTMAEIGGEVSAYELQELEDTMRKIAEDPPSNYTEIFQIRPRTLDPWLPEPSTSFEFASINFINDTLEVIEETEAVAVSAERASSAYAAHQCDCPYYKLQIQAVRDYTIMLIPDLTTLADSSAQYYEQWVAWVEETWGILLTPEDVQSFQQSIATEGFPESELQALEEGLLATDEEIELIKSEILSADPVAEWEDVESALPGLNDTIYSALPAFTDLASEAERILSILSGGGGGIVIPVDKLALLGPYIGFASTILAATVASAIYVKRVKRRKEKQ